MSKLHAFPKASKIAELGLVSFLWMILLSCSVGWIVFYGFPNYVGRDYFAGYLFPIYSHPINEGYTLGQFVTMVSLLSFWQMLLPFALVLVAKERARDRAENWRKRFYGNAILSFVVVAAVTYALGWLPMREIGQNISKDMHFYAWCVSMIGYVLLLRSTRFRRR